jgi:hypothetical protein
VVVAEEEGVMQAINEAASLLAVGEFTLALVMTRAVLVVLSMGEPGVSSVHSKSSKRNLQSSFDIEMVLEYCHNDVKLCGSCVV